MNSSNGGTSIKPANATRLTVDIDDALTAFQAVSFCQSFIMTDKGHMGFAVGDCLERVPKLSRS